MSKPNRHVPRGFNFDFDAWGIPFWQVLHSATFSCSKKLTINEKQRIKVLMKLYPNLLPCGLCGLHFIDTITNKLPLTDNILNTAETLQKWMVEVHNAVNKRIHKLEVPYEKVKEFYLKNANIDLRPRKKSICFKNITIILFILCLFLLSSTITLSIFINKK